MGLIGDILKGSQALRYHAKSAEIAGKNLSNINNPDYARQRVLAKEAYMYVDSFSLSTGGLRADGLDHMRNELLDRRVINEVSTGGSLEARKEILDLLQLILGERVDRQSLNAGLDDIHESDLAPGSLTRALNDFFNAFQELSAAPTEESVRQELIHKAKTLVVRINDMGDGLDQLEQDLSETVQNHVKVANTLLSRIHVINRDIRRFELQGKGKAADLRDLRQKALEDLSKILDFTATDDVDATSGEATGLINLTVKDKEGNSIVLLDYTGPKTLSMDTKLDFTMDTPTGEGAKAAQIRAVIDTEGKLSDVEIIDGGSGYDDSTAPINFTFTIPTTEVLAAVADAAEAETVADKIAAFIASGLIEKVTEGATKYVRTTDGLTDSTTDVVVNGFETDITLRPYKKGDIVVDGENYYQALADTLPWDVTQTDETAQTGAKLSDTTKFLKLSTVPDANSIASYDLAQTRGEGYKIGDLVENGANYYQAVGTVAPVVTETGVDGETTGVTTQAYQTGDVILYNGTYYQASLDAGKGASLENLGTTPTEVDLTAGGTGFVTLGADLPILGQEQILSRTQNQTFTKGDYVFDGENNRYYQATKDFSTNGDPALPYPLETLADLLEVNAFKLADGTIASRNGQAFDTDKFVELSVSYVQPDGSTASSDAATVATAEAVIKNGQIIGFNITNAGSGYPLKDSVFIDDVVLDVTSGSIHGYQQARQVEMENFRTKLNTLVGDLVTKVNQAYNPDDDPGKYVFGFPAMLSRVTQGENLLFPDQEGDGTFKLYKDEVDLTLPYAETDTFTVVNASAFFAEDRGTDRELLVEDPSFSKTYVGARRMQYVTIENDMDWEGDDGVVQTSDDGRSIMLAYEELPFRMVQGDSTFIFGDNFTFDALIKEHRNLAKALQLDDEFTFDNLIATHTGEDGANEVALAIAELGNADFTEQISVINTDVGTSLGDVVDNLEHQQMVEGILIDERQSISSVSLDEEVANLMRYQRAFQASARVITTLDNMLELVVMGLIR